MRREEGERRIERERLGEEGRGGRGRDEEKKGRGGSGRDEERGREEGRKGR